ncbi:SpoIID/LytB domain-containing protein [Aquipuribacter sp. SD81]|uniref:SpoIID/LytB domain-containing protein n=1 Tax=Aquipuribacter sp. SD81 TaxID=3127703 RepID=UPI003018A825
MRTRTTRVARPATGGGLSAPRRVLAAVVTALVTALVGVLVPGALAAPASAVDGDVVLEGAGFGHGRGMSQYGAYGRALAGQSVAQIVAFYYPGDDLATQSRGSIRVKVGSGSTQTFPLGAGSTVRDGADGTPLRVDTVGDRLRVRRVSGGFEVTVRSAGTYRTPTGWPASVPGPVVVATDSDAVGVLRSDGSVQRYRGTLSLVGTGTGSADLVNTLPFEQYLYSVVGAEMPSSWPAAALQAQAVAARSYAHSRCSQGATHFDVLDTTQCQVYRGVSRTSAAGTVTPYEVASVRAAVDATRDRVVRRGTAVVRTEFSSSNGGVTNGSNGWATRLDPYDDADGRNPYSRWSVTLTPERIERTWPAVGDFLSLTVTGDGVGPFDGRVRTLTVRGTAGRVEVTGEQARTALGLRSHLFRPTTVPPQPTDLLTYDARGGRAVVTRPLLDGGLVTLSSATLATGSDAVVPVTLPGGSRAVLTYDAGSGRAQLHEVGADGSIGAAAGATWSRGWDAVVAAEADGTEGTEVLTYNRRTGRAVVSDLSASGTPSTLSTARWSTGWDQVAAVESDGTAGTELLTYNRGSGRAVFSDLGAGAQLGTLALARWSAGWHSVVAVEADGTIRSEVLTYDRGSGRAVVSDLAADSSPSTLAMARWSVGWDSVVDVETDGTERSEVLTYNRGSGRAVVSDLAGASLATLSLARWSPGWTAVAALPGPPR